MLFIPVTRTEQLYQLLINNRASNNHLCNTTMPFASFRLTNREILITPAHLFKRKLVITLHATDSQ